MFAEFADDFLEPTYDYWEGYDAPVAAMAPIPPIEDAQTPEDFKRIELKLSQVGLLLSFATIALTIYGLQKGR